MSSEAENQYHSTCWSGTLRTFASWTGREQVVQCTSLHLLLTWWLWTVSFLYLKSFIPFPCMFCHLNLWAINVSTIVCLFANLHFTESWNHKVIESYNAIYLLKSILLYTVLIFIKHIQLLYQPFKLILRNLTQSMI